MKDVSVDPYLAKAFDLRAFNCWDLAREFWRDLTGIDLGKQTPYETDVEALTIRTHQVAKQLHKLSELRDPCFVLMCRSRMTPHVGVFYKGRVLHINERGAEYRPFDQVTACWPQVSFYTTELQ